MLRFGFRHFLPILLMVVSSLAVAESDCKNPDMRKAYDLMNAKYSLALSSQTNEDLYIEKLIKQENADKKKVGWSFWKSNLGIGNGIFFHIDKNNVTKLINGVKQADSDSVKKFDQSLHPISVSNPGAIADGMESVSFQSESAKYEIERRLVENLKRLGEDNSYGLGVYARDEYNLSAARATSAIYAKEAATFKDAVDNIAKSTLCHESAPVTGAPSVSERSDQKTDDHGAGQTKAR